MAMNMHLLKPQRYESVAPEQVDPLLANSQWIAEQKLDGVRCMVKAWSGRVELYASTGAVMTRDSHRWWTTLDAALAGLAHSGEWVLDGELLDDGVLWLFDAPLTPCTTFADPFRTRRRALEIVADTLGWTAIDSRVRVVPQAVGAEAKQALWQAVLANGKEGICLKHADRPYRTVAGGRTKDVIKVKRTYTVDAVVTATRVGGKDSGEVALYRNGVLVPVGKCTMGPDDAAVGDVIEVRFLYVNDLTAPRLYQPVMMRRRPDKAAADCLFDQLLSTACDRRVLEAVCA